MPREKQPWYRWQFSLPLTLFTALFAWMAWDLLADESAPLAPRIVGGVIFGVLALWFARALWRDRQPFRFKYGSSEQNGSV